ncbi:DUF3883 domain-containing protein [Kitasatospora herbaricolor]|uniref:DUF3883 domain-containing protein n=1 Tax=Kitasatospora herbaricolor TaxID=68217 RepID=A0ABZ1W9H3_9ACTN|nr:DUF3883 domain-containing protein [Kitasatospora herbaricolor]
MPQLPGDGTLKAALRWLQAMRTEDVPRIRALFTHHDAYADLTPDQYAHGLLWLHHLGLAALPRQSAPASPLEDRALGMLLLSRSLEAAGPGWEYTTSSAGEEGDLPAAAGPLAKALGLSHGDAAAAVTQARLAERARVGAAGEAALVELLGRHVDAEVTHVSALSDRFGYDIAVAGPGGHAAHIEVKTTTKPTENLHFLSRHEYETMRGDPAWVLATIRLDRNDRVVSVSTVRRAWVAGAMPADQPAGEALWESARLMIPPSAVEPGLPAVGSWLKPGHTGSLLAGQQHQEVTW